MRLPWVVVPIFRVVLPIWVVYPTSRNFGQVAQGRSTQLLGCNTLFHGAPGTFGEVTQGRRTHSIYCYILLLYYFGCCLISTICITAIFEFVDLQVTTHKLMGKKMS